MELYKSIEVLFYRIELAIEQIARRIHDRADQDEPEARATNLGSPCAERGRIALSGFCPFPRGRGYTPLDDAEAP
jgi:hypothetical protein